MRNCNLVYLCPLKFEHHDTSWGKLYIFADVYLVAGEDVGSLLCVAYYLGITFSLHGGSFGCAVDDGHDVLAVVRACHNVDAVLRNELSLLTLCYDLVALTPVEQTGGPAEHVVLCLGPLL